jgi:vancomycin resistance protein YoaR
LGLFIDFMLKRPKFLKKSFTGRVLPFASGATVMYNYKDLRLHNPTNQTFQLRLWLDGYFSRISLSVNILPL